MILNIINFFKSYRYIVFAVLVVGFVVAYSYYHDIAVAKAMKPSNSQCATGDGAVVRKFGLICF